MGTGIAAEYVIPYGVCFNQEAQSPFAVREELVSVQRGGFRYTREVILALAQDVFHQQNIEREVAAATGFFYVTTTPLSAV